MSDDEFDGLVPQLDDTDLYPETQIPLDDIDLSPKIQVTDEFTNYLSDIDAIQDDWDRAISSLSPDLSAEQESNEFAFDENDPTQFDDQNNQEDSNPETNEDSSTVDDTGRGQHRDISFGAAGKCWHCGGTGVEWGWGEKMKCSYCGGSGIG